MAALIERAAMYRALIFAKMSARRSNPCRKNSHYTLRIIFSVRLPTAAVLAGGHCTGVRTLRAIGWSALFDD
ncbi:MAG: hypothetical protein IJ191_10235 [Treponema sp.]|nr:hypothetical protein [Treponema sp.]